MTARVAKSLLLAPVLALLAACSQWPAQVGGGAAETFGPRPDCAPDTRHSARHALDHRLGCQLDRLAGLRLAGAAIVVPGHVERAQTQADRTVRELTGRLYGDAQYDLEILAAQLDEIERLMAASKATAESTATAVATVPQSAVTADDDAALRAIVARLDCHAQFASGSSDLDPRFASLLGELGRAMQPRADLSVSVTGHTDDVGSEESNQRLAASRAESVRSAIIAAGVDAGRIAVESAGESAPLFQSTDPAMRLANRRVELTVTGGEGEVHGALSCPAVVVVPH